MGAPRRPRPRRSARPARDGDELPGEHQGQKTISGQHNKEPASSPAPVHQQVKDITGQYPGLWGGDLLFTAADVANRQRVVDQAKTEWANGSLVALDLARLPADRAGTCAFDGGVKSRITDAQFQQIVTGGTALNTAWKQRTRRGRPVPAAAEGRGRARAVPAVARDERDLELVGRPLRRERRREALPAYARLLRRRA